MIEVKEIAASVEGYRLTNAERETIITYDETPDAADVFTYNVALIHRLDELYESGNPDIKLIRAERFGGAENRTYKVPKSWIAVRPPRKVVMTEERKRELTEQLRRINSKAVSSREERSGRD